MHASITIKILGLLLMCFSVLANLLPILVSLIYGDGNTGVFLTSMGIIFLAGFSLWLVTARTHK
jgi:trk system potassium uptake protein TrkH